MLTRGRALLTFSHCSSATQSCQLGRLLRFLCPFTTSLERAPWGLPLEQAVRARSRLRSRAFSAPQRLAHVRSSRPCFVPQPCPGFTPSEVSPHRSRALVSEPLAPLRLLPESSRWDRPSLVTVGFQQLPTPLWRLALLERKSESSSRLPTSLRRAWRST